MKIKANTLFIIFLFLFSGDLFSQENNKFLSVGIIPTYLIDPITPSIGISIEHNIYKNLNAEILYGFDPNIKFLNWHPDPYSRHHEYKFHLKYFFPSKKKTQFSSFIGIDYFGNYSKYDKTNSIYKVDGIFYRFSKAKITRIVNGYKINTGLRIEFSEHFYTESTFGIGARKVNYIYSTEMENLAEASFSDDSPDFDQNAGKKLKGAIHFGLKIGYRIY